MRWLIVCALLGTVGVGCATAPDPLPSKESQRRPRAKRVIEAPEPPQLVEGPDPQPPEAPPPEGDEPFEEGMASYYADMLSGNKTANGERYSPDKRTCAHRSHPFGTRDVGGDDFIGSSSLKLLYGFLVTCSSNCPNLRIEGFGREDNVEIFGIRRQCSYQTSGFFYTHF